MKKFLFAGLLCLGFAVAEDLSNNLEHLGRYSWSHYGLNGKVKKVVSCLVENNKCATIEFNERGIDSYYLKNRKLLNSVDLKLTFQYKIMLGDSELEGMEVYNRSGLIEVNHLKLPLPDGDHFVSSSRFEYLDGLLIAEGSYPETNEPPKTQYLYKDRVLSNKIMIYDEIKEVEHYNEFGHKVKIEYFDGPTVSEENFNYKYDHQNNWTEQYLNGQLYQTQKITYY